MSKLNKTEQKIMKLLQTRQYFGAEAAVSKRDYNACFSLADKGLVEVVHQDAYHTQQCGGNKWFFCRTVSIKAK